MYKLDCPDKFNMQLDIPCFSARYCKLMQSEKKNVLYIKDVFDNSTFRYRAYNVMEAMESNEKYFVSCFLVEELEFLYEGMDKIDIIILQRAKWSFELESFVWNAKTNNIKIIYDIDDLIYSPKYVPLYLNSIEDYREDAINIFYALASRYEKIACLCDGFITTTDSLAYNLKRDFGKSVWILPNFLNREQEVEAQKILKNKKEHYNAECFMVGYFSGSNTHRRDFELIESALVRLMDEYDDFYLKIVGYMSLSPVMQKYKEQGKVIVEPFVSFQELLYKVAEVDVNIIPLQKHIFNECKSELKYFEAAIVDTISIAVDNSVYQDVVDDQIDGFLCNELEWYEKLRFIYEKIDNMENVREKARIKCIQRYGNVNQAGKIEYIYNQIIENKDSEVL